jgi:three-Cys-motif partner protein
MARDREKLIPSFEPSALVRSQGPIVRDYIICYLKTVPHLRRHILIVDGFAGPGRFGDGSEGSPLIICHAVNEYVHGRAATSCIFSDTDATHRAALAENLAPYIQSGLCSEPYGSCEEALTQALKLGSQSTIFFYLDPYGIKDLEFEMVRQIYGRDPKRSTEVLINFSFRTFMRMSGNWDYADSASEISAKVKQGKTETLNRVMGGDYWLPIITDSTLGPLEREEAVMKAYLARVREYFSYAYAIPVKERTDEEQGIPVDQLARYHLIFATRHARAMLYMNDVARNALEPYLRAFRDGLLFDFTPERYQAVGRDRVKNAIVSAVRETPLRRPEIYERVIPEFFMQYLKKDHRKMIEELTFEDKRLYPDPKTKTRQGRLNDEVRLSASPWN